MSTDRFQLTTAFVLHSINYQESSLILRLLSQEYGFISAICKGARKAKNNKKALLQPFQPIRVDLAGKNELKIVTQVEAVTDQDQLSPMLFVSPEKYACGCYMNELLVRILNTGETIEGIFTAYRKSLIEIASDRPPAPVLRQFEWTLLTALGLAPDLSCDQEGEEIEPNGWYQVQPQQLPLRYTQQSPGAIDGKTLIYLQQGNFEAAEANKMKNLMQIFLKPLLGDKPLQSRKLWQHRR